MPECVDLTLDSDEDECTTANARGKKRLSSSPDSDIVLVLDAPKRQRPAQGAAAAAAGSAEDQDDDVVLESATGTVALKDLAHARPQCGNHAFRQSSCRDNSTRCEQCYCFVCDIKAADCQYWGDGSRARDHCNAHTSHYWNSLRKACRKGGDSSAALLQQEFSSTSSTLSTNWAQPAGSSKRSAPAAAAGRGVMSPLAALWGRKQSENATRTPPAPAATPAAAAAAAAAGGSGSTPATSPGGVGARVGPTSVKVEGTKQQQQPQQQKQEKKHKAPRPRPVQPPASTWLKRIPHPSQLKTPTQLLVRLELPFKTVKGVTVDEVGQRLVPCGFYRDSTKLNVQYGEHLLLDNITSGQYMPEKRKEVPLNLQLLPLRPADALPEEPDTDRPYKFTVISTTPGVKPMVMGVVVPLGCKLSKVKAALEEALAGHGFSSSKEGLLLGLVARGVPDDAPAGSVLGEGHTTWHKELDNVRLNDQAEYTNRHNTWLAVRVPASVAKDYYAPASSTAGMYGQSRTSGHIILLQHEQYQQRPAGAATSDAESDHSDSDETEDYDSADDDDDGAALYRYEQRSLRRLQRRQRQGGVAVREVTELGPPMAVLVPPGMSMNGGAAADKELKEAIIRHLVHYRAEGGPKVPSAPSSWEHLKVYRTSGANRQRLAQSIYSSPARDFSVSSTDSLWVPYQHPGVRMWVHWGTEPVQHPPGFDMAAFTAQPQLNDPAFEQRLTGLPDLLKAARAYESVMKMLRAMPNEIIRELQSACACSVPPISNTPAEMVRVTAKPSAAAVLKIVKAAGSSGSSKAGSSSKGGSSKGGKAGSSKASSIRGTAAVEVAAAGSTAAAAIEAAVAHCAAKGKSADLSRLGVLQVEVYVFTTPGRLHTRLFEDYDDWGSTIQGRPGRFRSTTCQLASVLNARLLQEAGGYSLLKEINALGGASKPAQGIAKLMEWVAAGERRAAVQPPGLTVTLHPYQLQSLAFMQEAEGWEGGWRRLLWRWLPPTPQQQQLAGPSSSAAAAAAAAAGGGGGGALVAASRPGDGPGVWWSPVLGRVASSVPSQPWGGFLAEEMGLGKTVEVLALILSNPPPPSVIAGRVDPESGMIVSRGTLVVCAVSLVGQWCTEAAKKLNGSLKMYPYHGQNRIRDKRRLATEFDIVVTTYATLGSDFGGKRNQHKADSPLGGIKWHRIVFDEGHTVKNMSAAHSKACTALGSDRRWICTGTPINNDISDLLGQFSVLHMQPFATKSYFDAYVKHAFASYGVSAVPLLYTLRHTMIRHTKAQTIQGQSVLALPDKTDELVPVVLSQAEREAYMRVHTEAARVWAAVRGMSANTINQKLLSVMALLQPLRRICSGGRLTPNDLRLPSDLLLEATAAHAAAQEAALHPAAAAAGAAGAAGGPLQVKEDCTISVPDLECPICLDAFDNPVMTLCHHWFCKECILGVLCSNTHCPLCRGPVSRADLRAPGKKPEPLPAPAKKKRRRSKSSGASDSEGGSDSDEGDWQEDDVAEPAAAAAGGASSSLATRRGTRFGAGAGDDQAVVCESKLRALLAELTAMRAADPTSKALVFSQYSNTLEWLKQRLPEEGFGYRTITGSMPLKQRSKAIEAFQGDPPTTVFLLSIRSGAVGINLTAANHVFLLEPCINPALEEQAIGRAWRMGQTRPVVVKRFYVKGSIEERIMDVRNIRQGHASHAAGAGSGSGAAAAAAPPSPVAPARMGRKKVGAAELAGNLQADRQVLKIAELDLLFRTPELDVAAADGAAAAGGGAAAAGSSGLASAAAAAAGGGDGAGSSRQAEQAAAAAAAADTRGGEQQQQQGQEGAAANPAAAAAGADGMDVEPADPAAAAAGSGGGGAGSMGPPAPVPQPHPSASAAAGAGQPGSSAAAAAAAAGGGGQGGGGGGEGEFPELPVGSQEARELAEAAGLQSSQEMTPYLLAQLQQQQRAWQLFEQMQQQQQRQ